MALGRKTGGRKAGTPNKVRPPRFKERMLEAQEAALARVEEITKQLPLEFLLRIMHDESYPPGARIECAKACLPFCHAKMAEQPSEEVRQITEIRRIIVSPKSDPGDLVLQEDALRLSGDAHQVVEPGAVRGTMPDEPDAVRIRKLRSTTSALLLSSL